MISLDGKLLFLIALLLVVFLIFIFLAARRMRRLLADSLRLRCENEALAGHLKMEKAKSEQLNASLLMKSHNSMRPVRPLHILVADDNTVNCDLARLLLEKDGHSVITVDDGLGALRSMGQDTFDLVFMDVQMPVVDGLTASRIIRKSENQEDLAEYPLPPDVRDRLLERCRGKHVPIIAMTAYAMEEDRRKSLNSGMDGFLTKPFDHLQIRQIIAEFCG